MGAWIEIIATAKGAFDNFVAPLVGAWIEIQYNRLFQVQYWVAPLVGAWIEIDCRWTLCENTVVAPLVGAWIEILKFDTEINEKGSLPLWERGLKFSPGTRTLLQSSRSPCGSVD